MTPLASGDGMDLSPLAQSSSFMILIIVIAFFAAVGVYRTLIKPDKPWHRWATFLFLIVMFTLPALTGWTPLR
jgi:hypothetical protein